MENAWQEFIKTGAPEDYLRYCAIKQTKEEKNAASEDKGACDSRNRFW